MTYLDEEIKRKLKLRNFKNTFQITKILEFEIHSNKKKIETLQFMEVLIVQDEKRLRPTDNRPGSTPSNSVKF